MDAWVEQAAAEIARHAERELEALVGVSTPSGDVPGAEEAGALCVAFSPPEAVAERIPCSTPDHADDLVLTLSGSGAKRLLLLGHLDTVVSNDSHRAIGPAGARLIGSGARENKGGRGVGPGRLAGAGGRPRAFPRAEPAPGKHE